MGISESESDIKKEPVLFIAGGAEVLAIAHRTQEEWPTFKLKKSAMTVIKKMHFSFTFQVHTTQLLSI